MYKVSVIIPTYRRPEYISDAIESVCQQSLTDLQIIVVDDNGIGTKDQIENENAIGSYIQRGMIHYIPHAVHKNGSAARNTGIRASDSEYVAFLDDDDLFFSTKIEKQISLMEEQHTQACLCGFSRSFQKEYAKVIIPKSDDLTIENVLLNRVDTCAGSCLIVSKKIANDLGGFDESFERHQDLEFLIRVLQKTRISVVNENLVFVRLHKQNSQTPSLEKTERQRTHFLEVFSSLIDSYPPKIRKEIYGTHYLEIAKIAIKNHNFSAAFRWIGRTGNWLRSMWIIAKSSTSYLLLRKE